MVLYFYLRRGELPGCRLRLQRGVAERSQASSLMRAKQASKLQKRRLWLSLHSSGLGRNFCQMSKYSFETLFPCRQEPSVSLSIGRKGHLLEACVSCLQLTLADNVVSLPCSFWRSEMLTFA